MNPSRERSRVTGQAGAAPQGAVHRTLTRGPWRWPLEDVGNREPTVLAEHVAGDRRGVDLGYPVAAFDSALDVPMYAAQTGEVTFALEDADGCAVNLDHGEWSTTGSCRRCS